MLTLIWYARVGCLTKAGMIDLGGYSTLET
jgi:hypothetical protein